jgi:hypothetical protein
LKRYFLSAIALVLLATPLFAAPKADKNAKSKYASGTGIGIAYKIARIEDGFPNVVSSAHTFASGDRLKLYITPNGPGYIAIVNIGPTGTRHVLMHEQVNGKEMIEVPRKGSMVMVGKPGTEKLVIMLSKGPNPAVTSEQAGGQAAQGQAPQKSQANPPAQQAAQQQKAQPAKPQQQQQQKEEPEQPQEATPGDDPTTPMPTLLASLSGAKDIVLEDDLGTSFGAINPKGYKAGNPSAAGLAVESTKGTNYGVISPAAFEEGQILTLEVKLKHK